MVLGGSSLVEMGIEHLVSYQILLDLSVGWRLVLLIFASFQIFFADLNLLDLVVELNLGVELLLAPHVDAVEALLFQD